MAAVKNSRARLGVERVEDRLVLTASVPTVNVMIVLGTLNLVGDDNNDSFSIQEVVVGHGQTAVHELEISGANGTRLTSSDQRLTVDAHGNIFVSAADTPNSFYLELGAGNNNVSISNLTTLAPSSLDISRYNSTSNNSVSISGVNGATDLYVALGSGNNNLSISDSSLTRVRAMLSSATTTSDKVQLSRVNVSGTTSITTGSGNDRVKLDGNNGHAGAYTGAVTISLGAGNDRARIRNAAFSSTLNIDGVSGNDVATGNAHITRANLTVVNATNHIHVR